MNCCHCRVPKCTTDHRGTFEHFVLSGGESIKTCLQTAGQCCGHAQLSYLMWKNPPNVPTLHNYTVFDQNLDQLFQIKRIPLCILSHRFYKVLRQIWYILQNFTNQFATSIEIK